LTVPEVAVEMGWSAADAVPVDAGHIRVARFLRDVCRVDDLVFTDEMRRWRARASAGMDEQRGA
jgi:hypothetical protein